MLEAITLNGSNVTAELDAYIHDNVFNYNGVFDYGNKLEASITSNNVITLKDGLLISQGRFLRIKPGTTEQVKIKSGRSGVTRKDLIVAHFETDGSNEIYDIRVLTGVDNGDVPKHAQGNTFVGDRVNELPLYIVNINGINIENIEKQFEIVYSLSSYLNQIGQQNLLINGDFQINQRGQNIYDMSSSGGYTLDMWRCYKLKVEILSDGWVRVSNTDSSPHNFAQHFQISSEKKYTFSSECRNVKGICQLNGEENDGKDNPLKKIVNGVNNVSINSLNLKDVAILIDGGASLEINYIRLNEGDILYQHVKEDKSIALLRCLERIEIIDKPMQTYFRNNQEVRALISYFKKREVPTIVLINHGKITGSSLIATKNVLRGVITETTTDGSIFTLVTEPFAPSYDGEKINGQSCHWLYGKILVTCEPV